MTGPASALAIAPIGDADVADVVALWQACGLSRPWNDPAADIALARKGSNATILTGRDDGLIVATVMAGHDGHRGWVYYLAVDPHHRHNGYGRAIMHAAEDWLRQRGIAKLQLLVRPDNGEVKTFYQSLGYFEQERVVTPNGSTAANRRRDRHQEKRRDCLQPNSHQGRARALG